jgi:hypothetical protein
MPSSSTIAAYMVLRQDLEEAQRKMAVITEKLVTEMEEEHAKSFLIHDNEGDHRFTYVRREVPVIDEKGLRRALTARVFDRYTTRKLDRKRLEEAMGTGAVDRMVVAKYVQMKDGDPYIKYTVSNKEEAAS